MFTGGVISLVLVIASNIIYVSFFKSLGYSKNSGILYTILTILWPFVYCGIRRNNPDVVYLGPVPSIFNQKGDKLTQEEIAYIQNADIERANKLAQNGVVKTFLGRYEYNQNEYIVNYN